MIELLSMFFFILDSSQSIDLTYFVNLITEISRPTIALFVVIDPIGNVPLFIGLTRSMSALERRNLSKLAILVAGILLILFAVAGTQILAIFGITISNFMIAGGFLLFIISVQLLIHGEWRTNSTTPDESKIIPLAFPLLAGPGAITSVMISFQTSGIVITIVSICIAVSLTYIIFRYSISIYNLLGNRGSNIFTRIFAVIISAIAVQYVVTGIKDLF